MTKGNGNRKLLNKLSMRLCLLCMRTFPGYRSPCRRCWKKAVQQQQQQQQAKPAPPPPPPSPEPVEDPFENFEEVTVGTFDQDMVQLDMLI